MGLDVKLPDPPELQAVDPDEYEDVDVATDADYRRDELSSFLTEGAWERAWDEWASRADLTERQWEIVADLGLIERFDFFWDSFANRVGYHAPGLPENWRERNVHPDLDSWEDVSAINASLTELGQTVCDVLKTHYIDWETEYEAPDDLPDL